MIIGRIYPAIYPIPPHGGTMACCGGCAQGGMCSSEKWVIAAIIAALILVAVVGLT